MTDAARLAAVLIRLIGCALIAGMVVALIAQVGLVIANPSPGSSTTPALGLQFWAIAALGYLLYMLPGLLLFRYARPLGIWLARGLD